MAFTSAQKDAARGHLNYPVTSWSMTFIGQQMDSLSSLSSDAETRCGDILTTMTTIETQLNTYRAASAGKQVLTDGTVYFQSGAIVELNNQYNYWQNKLSTLLDVPVYKTNQSSNNLIRG